MDNKNLQEEIKKAMLSKLYNFELRAKMAEIAKAKWEDPEYRKFITKRIKDHMSSCENARLVEIAKKRWANPEYNEAITKKIKDHYSSYVKARLAEITKKRWENSAYREALIKKMKEKWLACAKDRAELVACMKQLKAEIHSHIKH